MKKNFTKIRQIRNFVDPIPACCSTCTASGQTSHNVDVTNNKFTPAEITISQGDTVTWTNSEGTHNVNGLQSKFPSNPESFGNTWVLDGSSATFLPCPGFMTTSAIHMCNLAWWGK